MDNIQTNLITRLDYLIGFLDISSKESFEKVKGHKLTEGFKNVGEIYNSEYSIYRNQITVSAFLLGYSYFEAFLADLMIICLTKNPKLLIPKGKNQNKDKVVTYNQILLADSYERLVNELIEKEARNVMYKPMTEILDYFSRRLKLTWDENVNEEFVIANKIRNCCMHNNCIADKYLVAKDSRFTDGEEIELSSTDVHSFGTKARKLSRELWGAAKLKYDL